MFVHPLPGASVTGEFGWRVINGGKDFHTGTDFGAVAGTPIRAAAAGTVVTVGWSPTGYGNYAVIDHGNNKSTLYAHMRDPAPHRQGDNIAAGATVGLVGSTGWSTGPHLHFEVRDGGDAVDPLPFITNVQGEEEDMKGIIYRAEKYNSPFGVYAGPTGGFVVLANKDERENLLKVGTPEVWLTAKTLDELIKDARKSRG